MQLPTQEEPLLSSKGIGKSKAQLMQEGKGRCVPVLHDDQDVCPKQISRVQGKAGCVGGGGEVPRSEHWAQQM